MLTRKKQNNTVTKFSLRRTVKKTSLLIPTILARITIAEGSLILYYFREPFTLYAAVIEQKRPYKLLWSSPHPLWKSSNKIQPKKVTLKEYELKFCYFFAGKNKSVNIPLSKIYQYDNTKTIPVKLERLPKNPILTPDPFNRWESLAVFNTAALYLNHKVHLIYRAIGDKGLSCFGYASSKDGLEINERSLEPVYCALSSYLHLAQHPIENLHSYQSGINWAGCEDPRLSKVDDTIFMTYTEFDGVNPPGVALTSIKEKDFLNRRWNWQQPVLISAQNQTHKNWVIFPEKINNQYAVLHSLAPKILIEYYDTLNFEDNTFINSQYQSSGRESEWDNRMRGVGPPPIKTDEGWLVLYHAMDKRDPDRYKIGAMLLDLKEPTKILYRSPNPLLEPDAKYENHGFKSGVVYTCGAVVVGEKLLVYYGGADTVICAAFIKLNELLDRLKQSRRPVLRSFVVPAYKKKRITYVSAKTF